MFLLNLVFKNYRKIITTTVIIFLVLVSCESKNVNHSHLSLSQPLIDCENVVEASIQINKIKEKDKSINKKALFQFNAIITPASVFKTLCVAKVERVFTVGLSELVEYRLDKHFDAELILKFPDTPPQKIYFGRTTPDGFGQYVKIIKLPSFTNLFTPLVDVLVVPAYHLKLLEKSKTVFSDID